MQVLGRTQKAGQGHWVEVPESVTRQREENCGQALLLWFLWEEKVEEGQTDSEFVSYVWK